MNTIFLLHFGQRGKIGGMQLEDTPTGMSAPPLVPVCWGCPITTGGCKISFGSGRGFFKLKLGHCEIQIGPLEGRNRPAPAREPRFKNFAQKSRRLMDPKGYEGTGEAHH